MKPIRVLQVIPNMQAGGLESFIMNVYRHIDRNEVQFDFLVHYNKHCFFDDEIEHLGGKIYRFSVREDNRVFKYVRDLNRLFREHPEYKVIHGHMASLAFIYLYVAKKHKIPIRIIHSHNSNTEKTMKGCCKLFLSKFAKKNANIRFSCSEMAGKFLFDNENYKVIPNAIDIDKFRFNLNVRQEMRGQLAVEDKFVVGHIGRFNTQKNHMFLLDIFSEILKLKKDSVLLLIGAGETEAQVRNKVDLLRLGDAVRFLGVRSDVNKLYQAMDVFVLPSIFEGLPVVGIEAQAAGLPCVFSDTVTREAKITDLVTFESLNSSAKEWAECILHQATYKIRRDTSHDIIKAGYDINALAKVMENFYLEQYNINGVLK